MKVFLKRTSCTLLSIAFLVAADAFVLPAPPTCTLAALLASTKNDDTYAPRRVIVVGGGIGGLSSAYDARHMLNETDEITVVSDRPHFSFTPSNPWVAMGKRKPEDIQLDLTTILPKHKIDFVLGRAVKLEPSANNLRLEDGTVLSYDYLIIATGPRLAFEEVPGLKEFGESVCTTPHASKAAEALDQLVASPGPVVVGATQGASCFGPAYEYALLLQNTLKERGGKQLVNQCPITFVTSEPNVGHLGLGGVGESEQILTEIFENKHIEALTNTKTLLVKKYSVVVEQFDEKGKVIGQQSIPSKMTMLIPPFHGHDVWKAVPGLTDKIGMLLVNEKQQSLRYPNIFGVGVCVHLPPPERTALPMGSPKTGYMIESQGTAAVKNIHSLIAGIDIHSVATLNGVCITDFGDSGAVFVTIPQFHPRRIDATIHNPAIIAAKITFEKYFLHKIKSGNTDPVYEKYMLKLVGIERTFEV